MRSSDRPLGPWLLGGLSLVVATAALVVSMLSLRVSREAAASRERAAPAPISATAPPVRLIRVDAPELGGPSAPELRAAPPSDADPAETAVPLAVKETNLLPLEPILGRPTGTPAPTSSATASPASLSGAMPLVR